jgi:glycosyltransferase involved in cell wall biosynthesis
MKVFIGHQPHRIPYGGGNQFVMFLVDYLTKNDIEITYDLTKNIDIMLVINPFDGPMRKYNIEDCVRYRIRNPESKIVLRVNENDARKNTDHMDRHILYAINVSDYVIYISDWLKEYFIKRGATHKIEPRVIDMACDANVFYPLENKHGLDLTENKQLQNPIRIVTHHNSENWMKGFDIYQEIDDWLSEDQESNKKFQFVYIGDLNKNFNNKSTNHIPKTSIDNCAQLLRQCHIYVTATRHEPGGNHHVEAARSGLPILYHKDGGGVVEMCSRWGEEFDDIDSFKEKLFELVDNYDNYIKKIDYSHLSSERCCKEYLEVFRSISNIV